MNKYTPEFKRQAIELAKKLGNKAQAARQLNLPEGTLQQWATKAQQERSEEEKAKISDEQISLVFNACDDLIEKMNEYFGMLIPFRRMLGDLNALSNEISNVQEKLKQWKTECVEILTFQKERN